MDISECEKGVTDMSLIALVQNNPNLKFLNLFGCSNVSKKAGVNILEWAR